MWVYVSTTRVKILNSSVTIRILIFAFYNHSVDFFPHPFHMDFSWKKKNPVSPFLFSYIDCAFGVKSKNTLPNYRS